ncbi:hypothetical protein ACFWP5_08800 [Streptomyces sp. NPDC058469]|uniref:hypothetical protein n=1 Tax=Streptomyces sp. NPDC058469 TaxID=3346514 RepID=UPI00365B2E7C
MDTLIPLASTPPTLDATSTRKGKVQLAGDLAGTAASPMVKSRTHASVIGATTGDFPVSNYTATLSKSAFDQALEAAMAAGDLVFIRNNATAYTTRQGVAANDNKHIIGESKTGVTVQMENGRNVSMVISGKPSGLISGFRLSNVTLDHNGINQTAGGGIVIAGIQDSIFENVDVINSFRFCVLIQGFTPAANLTGTITLTNGSEVVSGSGTSFTTELAAGSIIKEPTTGEFARVVSVISNTSLRLTRPWSFATQTGVTYKLIAPNTRNHFLNVRAFGTIDARDNMGFGLSDYSVVERCYSTAANGAGCGFVPDHSRGMRFTDCLAANNGNAGFSYETCEDMETINCISFGAVTGNGFQLISGGVNSKFTNCIAFSNTSHGFAVNNNNASYPVPLRNTFTNITAYENGGYGVRVDGAHETYVRGDLFNNALGGYIQNTANSVVPANTILDKVRCYDDRTTKVQARGIWLVTGTNALVLFPRSADADNVTAGITDTATNTNILYADNGNIGIGNKAPINKLNLNTPATADALAQLMLYTGGNSNKGLVVQATASQSGNLMEFQSSAGNPFVAMTSGGLMRGPLTSSLSTPAYSFFSDSDTGMTRPSGSANTLDLITGGNVRLELSDAGFIDVKTQKISNVVDPTSAQDAATKAYTDTKASKGFAIGMAAAL